MADLKITTAAVKAAVGRPPTGAGAKGGPSAFESIRSKIAEKVVGDVKLPAVAPPTAQQVASLDKSLQKQLERTDARSATEFFSAKVKDTGAAMDRLSQKVDQVSPRGVTSPLRDRLNSIEQQFQKTGTMLKRVNGMDPKALLNVQVQFYQVAENMELLSKVVDQVSSGAKTVMQTQV